MGGALRLKDAFAPAFISCYCCADSLVGPARGAPPLREIKVQGWGRGTRGRVHVQGLQGVTGHSGGPEEE